MFLYIAMDYIYIHCVYYHERNLISNAGSCKVYRHRSPVQIWYKFLGSIIQCVFNLKKKILKKLIYFMLSRYPKRVLKLKSSLNASERWSSALKQALKILEQIYCYNKLVLIIYYTMRYGWCHNTPYIYCILERKKS